MQNCFIVSAPPNMAAVKTLYTCFDFFWCDISWPKKQAKAGEINASFDFSKINKDKIITNFFNEK